MQIVIDINEHLYKTIKTLGLVVEDGDAVAVSEAIKNGILLPQGHGRLIDADAVLVEPFGNTYKDLDIAETIVEADGGAIE